MKVTIVTSTRADFGILHPLIQCIEKDPQFELTVIATGSHFDKTRGNTIEEIERAGIRRVIRVPTDTSDTSKLGVAATASKTLDEISKVFQNIKPQLVIILGDRYEILSVAFAAFLLKIPLAHISGGDLTAGALDDSIRHGITKLSSIHFTTTETYKKRVIQLGEQPSTVFNVGNLCIDNIKKLERSTKQELEEYLKFSLTRYGKNILVTLHPETTANNQIKMSNIFFSALRKINNIGLIITYPNHDAGSENIIEQIKKIKTEYPDRICVSESLGMTRYHSLLRYVDCVAGNSSSGITEVPSYGIPTIDMGDRQKGRVRASSVINIDYDEKLLVGTLRKVLSNSFSNIAKHVTNPYGDGNTSERIIAVLKNLNLDNLIKKEFYDIY